MQYISFRSHAIAIQNHNRRSLQDAAAAKHASEKAMRAKMIAAQVTCNSTSHAINAILQQRPTPCQSETLQRGRTTFAAHIATLGGISARM
jgi:hypothetical protein